MPKTHIGTPLLYSVQNALKKQSPQVTPVACYMPDVSYATFMGPNLTALTKIMLIKINCATFQFIRLPSQIFIALSKINQCAVLIYLYCPHKYSTTSIKKIIEQLIIISAPSFTHITFTKNYTVYHKNILYILTQILYHSEAAQCSRNNSITQSLYKPLMVY